MKYFPKKRFLLKKEHNRHWSTLICFCSVLASEPGISRITTRKHFNDLIDKDDYLKSEKEQVFNWLWKNYKNGNLAK